jgi:hypothetical protein
MATLNKNKRRPGRPPKNLVLAKKPQVKEPSEKKPAEEQLILYLPNFDDEPITNTEKNDFDSISESQMEPESSRIRAGLSNPSEPESSRIRAGLSNPSELESSGIRAGLSNPSELESSGIRAGLSKPTDPKNNKLKHLTDNNDSDTVDSNDSENINVNENINNLKDSTIEKLIDELHRKDAIILNLKSKLKDKTLYNENIIAITKENKKKLVNIGLISINNNKLNICEKTDIACWWCTHNFDSAPVFLPDHYKNNTYFVFGNFCGFSCMLAYNENLDDYRKSVRTVLIKQMYRDVFQNENMIVKSAGPRELLKKFGGPLDISQYRDPNNICIKTFKMTLPPMIPLISEMEEINLDK